jgi:hypothetical protein
VTDGLRLGDEPLHRIDASKEHAFQLIGSVRDALKPSGDTGNADGLRLGLALLRRVPGAAYLLDGLMDAVCGLPQLGDEAVQRCHAAAPLRGQVMTRSRE